MLCGIMTLISILLVKYDPNFKNTPVWFLFLVSGGWYISLALYLDRKNFYLQTTTEGISWGNLLSISYDASYEDITKFSYETRGIYGLTWLVVKTNHGKTLRFDPLLTGSGSLIPQLAFRVENGYWAKSADPEDQQLLQNFIDKPEKARELLMSWSPCVIER